MTEPEHQKEVKSAMRVFLSLAALVFAGAFTYSFSTGNTIAQVLLIGAVIFIGGMVFYLNKK